MQPKPGADAQHATDVLIPVRFGADGGIESIGGVPRESVPSDWFDFLASNAASSFHSISSVVGVFRLDAERYAALATTFRGA